ncbi:chromatin-binding protein [Saccharomycopsis crataegensis]|uniref:Chromatin-binding protein n=1 Tax=Saccharomycopsis crataegensis TaxID=43959 RepID=A0AAV5QJI9_9ASCO|nr:chromatin-binding protein [Saccharomycopsis crataegensis]
MSEKDTNSSTSNVQIESDAPLESINNTKHARDENEEKSDEPDSKKLKLDYSETQIETKEQQSTMEPPTQTEKPSSGSTSLEKSATSENPSKESINSDTQPKTTDIVFKEDGTVDTSQMIPAAKPDLKIEENISNAMPNHQKQYLLKSLKSIKRLKDSSPFLLPVDIVKLQIPFYYNFIPKPMDLSTIEKKLTVDGYETPDAVHEDFNLMISNCIKFNGEKASISRMGLNIQASFEKLLLNVPDKNIAPGSSSDSNRNKRKPTTAGNSTGNGVPKIRRDNTSGRPKREIHPPKPKDMPYDIRPRNKKLLADLRFAGQTLKELTSKKHETYNYPFLEPVDPVALDCPTYFDIVKIPMDLSTIQNKLQNNQYNALEEFYNDVKLVFKNCYAFNPENTPVNLMGHKLEAIFDKKWLDKPVHDPTPPPGSAKGEEFYDEDHEDDDEEFDEEDEIDIEQSIMNNQAIQFLEAQIERMKKDLEKMKKEEYEKAKKRALKQKKKKGSAKGKKSGAAAIRNRKLSKSTVDGIDEPIELTFDMKKELSEKINYLNEKKLQHVMKIINESVPDLQKDGEDEIELDMDMVDDETLLKLYNYVVAKNSNAGTSKKGKGKAGNGKAKRKSITKKASDRDKKIDILKQRLEEYDKGNSYQNGIESSDEDDEDDDDESESSEEE